MYRTRDIPIHTWAKADAYLKDNKGKGGNLVRKVAHNTYVVRGEYSIEVTLHGHTIIRYFPDGMFKVYSCGYRGTVTKQRLNVMTPSFFHVYQDNWAWFVSVKGWIRDEPFWEGMLISAGYHE